MGLSNILILFNVTLYVIIFIFSVLSFIPIIINNAQFNGHCLLFSSGKWTQNSTYLDVDWGSNSYCDFPLTISIMSMLFALFYIFWLSIHLFKDYVVLVCN